MSVHEINEWYAHAKQAPLATLRPKYVGLIMLVLHACEQRRIKGEGEGEGVSKSGLGEMKQNLIRR